MRVSASMMNTWMKCPLQAKFRYFDFLPDSPNAKTAFGSCIHHALEHYNNSGDLESSVELFRKVWDDPALIGATFDWWPKFTSFGGLMNRGVEILREYDEKNKWESRTIVATEHRFRVPFGNHTLTGIVDLLEVKKSGRGKNVLRIIDYKSASRAPSLMELRVNIQFTVYHYASMQKEFWVGDGTSDYRGMDDGERLWYMFQNFPRRSYWYHLMTNKELDAGDRDDADFNRLHRVANEIEKAIQHDVFVPNISGESCIFCPYTEPCQLPIRGNQDEDELQF